MGCKNGQMLGNTAASAFAVRSIFPDYPAEERELVRREIEYKLFDIFCKYCRE